MKNLVSERIEKIINKIKENGLDAIVSTTIEGSSRNPRYLSNYSGSFAYVVISPDFQVICTDSRYWDQVKEESPLELKKLTKENFDTLVPSLLSQYKKIGFEEKNTTVVNFNKLKNSLREDQELIPCDEIIEELRISKHPKEIECIAKACEIAEKALAETLDFIKEGKTEKETAAFLEYKMFLMGAEDKAFGTIVASGYRGAMPHGAASGKEIKRGELIVIDYGCVYSGYRSDITRTVALGEIDSEMKKVYNIVKEAQEKASGSIQAGMTGKEADYIARKIIIDAGYGDFFGHGLGHGLGLDTHEDPSASYKNEKPLPEGAVVTVEPGIYIPGKFGVRIEDDVYLLKGGRKILNSFRKDLIVLK